jgi:PAS domain S-box-containing protein
MAIKSGLEKPTEDDGGALADEAIAAAFAPFANAPLAMVMVDRSGRILQANPRLEALFGYGAGDLAGKSITTLLPAGKRADHDLFVSAYFDYPATRQMSRRTDLAGQSTTGELVPVEIGLTTLHIEDTLVALAWVFDLRDRDHQDRQFELMVEGSPNGILLVDGDGMIALCNGRACEMFGYTREEFVGTSIDVLVPRNIAPKHRVYRSNFQEAPRQRSMGRGRELHALRRDGTEFAVEIGLTPIETPEGRFTAATVIDISARQQTEAQLRQTNEELLSFAYSASHDLKAPLATISGLADVVLEDLETGDISGARERVLDMQTKAVRLAALVESVLALARADRVDADNRFVVMAGLVADLKAEFETACRCDKVQFRSELTSRLEPFVEPARLKLILRNLVLNALKYRNTERSESFVSIETRDEPGWIAIEVRDNGLGIPEKNQDQVFQMFRRFHAETAEGYGLGLAMVKKQVEYLQGKVSFTSNGDGTTFQVLLPVKEGS